MFSTPLFIVLMLGSLALYAVYLAIKPTKYVSASANQESLEDGQNNRPKMYALCGFENDIQWDRKISCRV